MLEPYLLWGCIYSVAVFNLEHTYVCMYLIEVNGTSSSDNFMEDRVIAMEQCKLSSYKLSYLFSHNLYPKQTYLKGTSETSMKENLRRRS